MKKTLTLTALGLGAVLALSACSAPSGGGNMPGMDHGPSQSASAAAAQTASAGRDHNAADTMFAAMMIPHHRQAVEMSGIMLEKKDLPKPVSELAERIRAAQGPEIETMTGWLNGWGEDPSAHGGHQMQGMMGPDDLDRLKAAQGTEAARMFLTQMIAHHEGALTMAQAESRDGKNPQAVALSKEIVAAQSTEIAEMKQLLAGL
ncbi:MULTISPECIES: DUF305 domain-containing protein [Arthrobacter]|uniref:DUF305 domain-containing protein n=2 Tax=Arthrobacter TaxID=1663 RepID=A0ABU9KKX3_9MICC|nr:DUF305 domain-containing protein [Arthrobacter sp. YJM1]MDP5227554.1 DUF305 domain-containing protein [Arthrobacter sp. YJM1]